MIKRFKSISTCFLILLFLPSCQKEELKEITISQSLTAFEEIEVNDAFDLFLTQDSIYSIKIEGSKKFAGGVVFSVEANKLTISNEAKNRWLYPEDNKVKIYISSNRPKFIKVNETCSLRTTNAILSDEFGLVMAGKLNMATLELNCNTFYFWNNHPCAGLLELYGQVNYLKIWNSATMSVNARGLLAQRALVENNSQGDCNVWVRDQLEYSINSTGNINLYGSPPSITLLKEHASRGKLFKY